MGGPDGADLPLGPGVHELQVEAGPAWRPRSLRVELEPGAEAELGVTLEPAFDARDHVRIGFSLPADRARDFRGTDGDALRRAAGAGFGHAVFATDDDLLDVQPAPGEPVPPRLTYESGLRYAGDGWSVSSWPWTASRRSLHGGIPVLGLGPQDAAAALEGAESRALRVDVGWLEAVSGTPVFALDPVPEFVALGPPGDDLAGWRPWFTWLDTRRALIPTGPTTWVPVADGARYGASDVLVPLFRGDVTASTGARLTLRVDGRGPGEVVGPGDATGDTGVVQEDAPRNVVLTLRAAAPYDRVTLVGTGGVVLARAEVTDPHEAVVRWQLPLPEGWVVGLASRRDDPEPWAVTGPVWIGPPP